MKKVHNESHEDKKNTQKNSRKLLILMYHMLQSVNF